MKKLFTIISIAVLAAACSKEPNPTPQPEPTPVLEKVYVEFSANLDEDTKATIGGMTWEAGDEITVWVKSAIGTQGYDGDELEINPLTKKFSGEIVKPQDTDVLYVAYGTTRCDKENGPIFAIPAIQNNAANGETKAMLKQILAYVKGETDLQNLSFTLTAATAKLVINVTGGPVKGVEFSGMNGEVIAADNATTISYENTTTGASEIELIVPAINFPKGYKVVYTKGSDKMYQSYGATTEGGITFEAGHARTINCTFVPFNVAVSFEQVPMSSYSYYLKGDAASITKANSANFETTGENGSGGSGPDIYDDDAKGFFTGTVEGGVAKVVISGASSAVMSSMTISEWGYYVTCAQRVDEVDEDENNSYLEVREIKVKVAENQTTPLAKSFTWNVCAEADPTTPTHGHDFTKRSIDPNEDVTPMGYSKFYAGEVKLNPYIIVDGVEYSMVPSGQQNGESVYITGLPHRSNHKDLWYVAKQRTRQQATDGIVSGEVRRINDESGYPVDMFYSRYDDGSWDDFCVKSRGFSIPEGKTIDARPVMYGVLWGGNHILFASPMNAYFYYDAEKGLDSNGDVAYTLHNTPTPSGSKTVPEGYAAKIELADATKTSAYGYTTTSSSVALSPEFSHMNIYMWIYRGDLRPAIGDTNTPGYWCRYIQVQYAQN